MKYIAVSGPTVVSFSPLNESQVKELLDDNDVVLRVSPDGTVEEFDEYDGWLVLESHSYYLT